MTTINRKFSYEKLEEEDTIVIHIASKDCVKVNNKTNHIILPLNTSLYSSEDEVFEIQFLSATIPYSWYSINYSNKYIDVKERISGVDYFFTISITEGNYNAISLLNKVQIELNNTSPNGLNYTLDYNKITNKAEFDVDNVVGLEQVVLLFNTGPNAVYSMETVLGFWEDEDIEIPAISTSTMNLNPYANVFVYAPNLGITNCYDSLNKQNTTILAKVPVNVNPFSNIFYENDLFVKYISSISNISSIELMLRDEFALLIDLNQNEWFCSLKIKKLKHTKPVYTREEIDEKFFGPVNPPPPQLSKD